MEIRKVKSRDYDEISKLIKETFSNTTNGYGSEAELVEKIRESDYYIDELEVVAIEDNSIIGHGLLSEVDIIDGHHKHKGLVLAPLEVNTRYQKKGIGTAILNELEKRAKGYKLSFISILGHPSYYSKFGYIPASKFHITAPFSVPDEAFMIKAINNQTLDNISGMIKYSEAFN